MAHRNGPPDSWLKARLTEGLKYREIAELWNREQGGQVTTTNAIKTMVSRQGLANRANRYTDVLPWVVKGEHLGLYHAKLLRLLARTERGLSISGPEQRMLDMWLERMGTDKVVAYDRDTEDGFFVVARQPADGDGWVRVHLTVERGTTPAVPCGPAEVDLRALTPKALDGFIEDLLKGEVMTRKLRERLEALRNTSARKCPSCGRPVVWQV